MAWEILIAWHVDSDRSHLTPHSQNECTNQPRQSHEQVFMVVQRICLFSWHLYGAAMGFQMSSTIKPIHCYALAL